MTQDEIIGMAKQAGMEVFTGGYRYMDDFDIHKFAALVAAAEREACADMVNKYIKETDNMEARGCLVSVAYDIKARKQE